MRDETTPSDRRTCDLTCPGHGELYKIQAWDDLPGGHIDVFEHTDTPWHGPAVRVTLRNPLEKQRFFHTRQAAQIWCELNAPGITRELRDAFYDAVENAHETGAGRSARYVMVMTRTGQRATGATDPRVVSYIDPGWSVDNIAACMRSQLYWSYMIKPPRKIRLIPAEWRADARRLINPTHFMAKGPAR